MQWYYSTHQCDASDNTWDDSSLSKSTLLNSYLLLYSTILCSTPHFWQLNPSRCNNCCYLSHLKFQCSYSNLQNSAEAFYTHSPEVMSLTTLETILPCCCIPPLKFQCSYSYWYNSTKMIYIQWPAVTNPSPYTVFIQSPFPVLWRVAHYFL